MCTIGNGLLKHIGAQCLSKFRCFRQGIAFDQFVTANDNWVLRGQNAFGETGQNTISRPDTRINAGRSAKIDTGFLVQNIARQRQKNRA